MDNSVSPSLTASQALHPALLWTTSQGLQNPPSPLALALGLAHDREPRYRLLSIICNANSFVAMACRENRSCCCANISSVNVKGG